MEEKIHTWSAERETRPAKKTGLGRVCVHLRVLSLTHICVKSTDTSAWATRSFFSSSSSSLFFFFMTLISWVGSLTWAFACLRHDHPSHASGRPLWRQLRGGYERPVDSTTTSFLLFSFPESLFSSPYLFFSVYIHVCVPWAKERTTCWLVVICPYLLKRLFFFFLFFFCLKINVPPLGIC